MTGFGRAAAENARHAVAVSLRGVNHRYLDLKIRIDEAYVAAEAPLRQLFGRELHRGRVDVKVEVRRLGERRVTVHLHRGVLEALQGSIDALVGEGLLEGRLRAADVLRLPEVLQLEAEDEVWSGEDQELLESVAAAALGQLVEARRAEGELLQELLLDRLSILASLVRSLDERRTEAVRSLREGLERRLEELLTGSGLDRRRLEEEVALLADRSDVREELDRLGAHLEHFRALLEQPGSIGKRLDFLAQEILRELNTLGAKCRNAAMIQDVLEAKSACEQLREQVQNVE